ncbi:hypothetical protein LTT66_00265 [Nocardia gipuzkoensis]|uniref:hypothetical protein n=1 Tax=Nocardia gipuzkoensis TaxID=2749991 RepID=UPI001E36F944|nr:hypothetical protein [Nocardia gipuzkoensis]UGT68714.1 hypothetical protein LTT66_00265 [Nocardia gipuzkoensis]
MASRIGRQRRSSSAGVRESSVGGAVVSNQAASRLIHRRIGELLHRALLDR